MGRWFHPVAQVSFVSMLTLLVSAMAKSDDTSKNDRVQRKVAVIELSRSIRNNTVNTMARADCLVEQGRLSRNQANQAFPIQLREVGISQHVMTNPQVLKTRDLLLPLMDETSSGAVDGETAQTLVNQVL